MQKNKSTNRRRAYTALLSGSLLFFTLPQWDLATASNAITIDNGYGLSDTRLLRLNYSVGNDRRWPAQNDWSWGYAWETNLSYWYLYRNKEGDQDLFELGLTPNFRIERNRASHWGRPYMEAGLGVHLLSLARIGERELGSHFQFGTHVGFGIHFGNREQWELAWRYQHLSNAGLKEPNPGINFGMVRFGYRW